MADGTTPRGYTLPEVGGSVDTWGSKLNTNFSEIDTDITDNETKADNNEADIGLDYDLAGKGSLDSRLDVVEPLATDALPKSGDQGAGEGEMTGRVDVLISTTKVNALGTVSGAQSLDADLGNYHSMTLSGDITDLSFSNLVDVSGYAQVFILDIISAGYEITWNMGTINWAYGEEPELSTTGGRDIISLITLDGGATWTGALSQPDCQ